MRSIGICILVVLSVLLGTTVAGKHDNDGKQVLEGAVQQVIANRATFLAQYRDNLQAIKIVCALFKSIDQDGDGKLSADELFTGWKTWSNNIETKDGAVAAIKQIETELQEDHDGHLQLREAILYILYAEPEEVASRLAAMLPSQ